MVCKLQSRAPFRGHPRVLYLFMEEVTGSCQSTDKPDLYTLSSPGTGMWDSPLGNYTNLYLKFVRGKKKENLRKLTAEFLRKVFTSNFDNHWSVGTASW